MSERATDVSGPVGRLSLTKSKASRGPRTSPPAIALRGVGKRFGARVAVRDLSFTIAPGEVVGFVGPNGSGKTTTLRIISGYLDPDRGSVHVAGHEVARERMQVRALLGYMAEGVPAYRDMRVAAYLRLRARLRGVARKQVDEQVARACQRSGLDGDQRRLIGQLSKGYRQRVGLADALLAEPPILLLDEPTAGLDPLQLREFRALIGDLAPSCTVLICSHILPQLEALAERMLVINQGALVGDGSMSELRAQSQLDESASLEQVFLTLSDLDREREAKRPASGEPAP